MAGHEDIEIIHDTNYYTRSRLPVDLAPEHYTLTLSPNLKSFSFEGQVEIDFRVTRNSVTEVILNGVDLAIQAGYVVDVDNFRINLKTIIYNNEREIIALRFDTNHRFIPKRLTLKFNGVINDKMKSFYRSKIEVEQQELFVAATQFCPTDARRTFPCFDEPIWKASFELTLIYDAGPIILGGRSYKQVALSNGDIISEDKSDDGRTVVRFETTPNMSSYLLTFIVGPFEFVEAAPSLVNLGQDKCRIRVYATPGKREQGKYALEVATKALSFYENYFDIKYPLSKLDLIALPELPFGAMENWGIITYRETVLLHDPMITSTASKQYIAIVIAHEIAHQWFGNLVTMAWWNDLWLNEGFASFMQYLCTDRMYPSWDLWSQFVSDMWSPAMVKDSLRSSHPVEVPVNRESEINEIFDEISYKKGCSVLRMLYSYIGDDMFRLGLKHYLLKFSYENTNTNDFWDCLAKASNKPISQMMSTWTNRIGYPWIKVEVLSGPESEDMIIRLEQQRFTANKEHDQAEKDQLWMVPISIVSGSKSVAPITQFLDEHRKTFIIPKQGDNWIKLNRDTIGFYRTAYPSQLLDRLIDVIKGGSNTVQGNDGEYLSSKDRFGILSDYFALCQAGHVETSDLIRLLASFENESNYTVWRSIDNCIFWLSILFRKHEAYHDKFIEFARQLYRKIYSKLTWEPVTIEESHTDPMLRALVINRLVLLGDSEVIYIAKKYFIDQVRDDRSITADLRDAVYSSVSIFGCDSEFDELFAMFTSGKSQEENNRVLKALGLTRNQDRLKRVMELILTVVKNQDKVLGITSIACSDPSTAWQLFKENHEYFRKIYEAGTLMSSLVKFSTEYFSCRIDALEVERFFETNKFPQVERTIQQSLETIRINADWSDRIRLDASLKTILA